MGELSGKLVVGEFVDIAHLHVQLRGEDRRDNLEVHVGLFSSFVDPPRWEPSVRF